MAACKLHIPTFKSKPGNIPKPPWIDEYASTPLKEKHHTYIRYINTLTPEYHLKYTKARNKAKNAIRHAKHAFERKLAAEAKSNNKAVWKYVSSKTKDKVGVSDLLLPDGTLRTTEHNDKAECLNKQYSSVFTSEDMDHISLIPPKHWTPETKIPAGGLKT